MMLRNFAAALRAGEESIDIALLGATMKAIRERASGVPAERDELMAIFRQVLGEEARRLGLDVEDEPLAPFGLRVSVPSCGR